MVEQSIPKNKKIVTSNIIKTITAETLGILGRLGGPEGLVLHEKPLGWRLACLSPDDHDEFLAIDGGDTFCDY